MLNEHYQAALERSEQTYSTKSLGINLVELVENKKISFHEVASIADHAGLSRRETGTLVHRIAELRTLFFHRKKLLAGKRFVELGLRSVGGSRSEIDLVTIRGNQHYIHDYKPINVQEIQNKSWSKDFNRWLASERGGDYRQIGNYRSMPPNLRTQFKQFLGKKITNYHNQLDEYKDVYSESFGVSRHRIKTSVVPYYVQR